MNLLCLSYFSANFYSMSTEVENKQEGSSMLHWLLFLISTAICIYMVIYINEWFWVVLPFSLTYLVKALRVI